MNLLLSPYHSPPRKLNFSTPVSGLHVFKNLLMSTFHSLPWRLNFSTLVAGLHLFRSLLLSGYHLKFMIYDSITDINTFKQLFKLKVYYYSPYYYSYWLFGCIPQAFHRKKNSLTIITTKWDTAESIKLSSLNIRSLIKHSEDFENDCFLNKSDFLIKVISLSNITWLLYTDMPKKDFIHQTSIWTSSVTATTYLQKRWQV